MNVVIAMVRASVKEEKINGVVQLAYLLRDMAQVIRT
jgi:hypothetical protein